MLSTTHREILGSMAIHCGKQVLTCSGMKVWGWLRLLRSVEGPLDASIGRQAR